MNEWMVRCIWYNVHHFLIHEWSWMKWFRKLFLLLNAFILLYWKLDFRGFELLNCLCYAKEHRLRSNSILHFSVHLIVFNVYVMSRSMLLWVQLQFWFEPYSSHCNGLMIWWITEIGVWSKSNICIHWNHSTNIYVEYFWLYTEWLIQSNSVLRFYYS